MERKIYMEEALLGNVTKEEALRMLGSEREVKYGSNGRIINVWRDDMENINIGLNDGDGCYLEVGDC